MKRLITIIGFLVSSLICFAQDTEFGHSNNGLIYSDTTMKQLRNIVNTLNIKFRSCDLNKQYLSKLQARANYVSLEKGLVKEARKDMDAGISFDDFVKKYKATTSDKELLVIKDRYKDYNKKDVVAFESLELGQKHDYAIRFDKKLEELERPVKGRWIYQYTAKSKDDDESIAAFYFIDELTSKPLPEVYARMIQYSDCMVDTNTQIFYDKARYSGMRYRYSEAKNLDAFINYVHKATNQPQYDEKNAEKYFRDYRVWDSLRVQRVDSMKNVEGEKFAALFNAAFKDATDKGYTNDELEEYIARYHDKKLALELKRNRIVVGGCSMDNGPRVHALNIARLSAETVNWEIFLRSHLDIMNDRFERASDGSYAWGGRKTYIKELELLDINVPELMLGVSLRLENANKNHYFGSIVRIGRALSESVKPDEVEAKMLQMIADNQLDDYNRMLMYYLFVNYNQNIKEDKRIYENRKKLALAVNTLPKYLSNKM